MAGAFAADAPPVAPAASRADAPDGQVPDVVVEAPEPRYVAPTRRDKIGRIWAPVLINDQGPFRLVLDTGASNSAVNADVAAALGLPLNDDHPVLLNGVTGARQVATIPIDSLVVGDLELRSKRLPIVVDALGGAQGVLGTEGLQDKRIYIDFRHDKITIFRSHSERAPPGFTTIPIKLVGGLLLVANIRVGGVRAKAIIDTGGQATIANLPMREALIGRLRPEDIKADEITGATLDVQRGDRLVMPPIRIGDLTIRGENITVGDMYIFQHWHMTTRAGAADRHGHARAGRHADHRLQAQRAAGGAPRRGGQPHRRATGSLGAGEPARQRQRAHAAAGRRVHRVRDGRLYAGGAGLADAARLRAALDQVGLDARRLADPQHRIVIEVRLLHAPVGDRDLAGEYGTQAEDHAACELRMDRVGIDRLAAVEGADDALDAHAAVGPHLDLGDLREVAAEGELDRHAAAVARRQRRAPAGLRGGEVEHRAQPRVLEQRPAVGDRVLRRRRRRARR